MAFVSSGCFFSSSMASTVGRTSNVILRRLASLFTLSITGKAPVPVPMIRRRHRQGISSSTESGVCPNSSRNFFDGFFLRLRTSPRSITTSCSYVTPSIRIVPKENFWKRILDLHLTDKTFSTRYRLVGGDNVLIEDHFYNEHDATKIRGTDSTNSGPAKAYCRVASLPSSCPAKRRVAGFAET